MTLHDELDLLDTGAAIVDRSDRGQVLVTGTEAFSFLQALVSADLEPLVDGDGVRSLLLTPQGKLDVAFRLLRVGDDAWLDTDPGFGGRLATSLDRFKIRVQAEVMDRSDACSMLSLVGPEVLERWTSPVPVALHQHAVWDDVRMVRTETGLDLLGASDAIDAARATLVDDGWSIVGPVAFDAYRIERGVAIQPLDIDDKTIPQEAELEHDTVSFTKGCFLGQELVCRIDSRGHVNRFLRRFGDIVGDWPEPGAQVVVDDSVVGTLTSVAPVEVPTGALGYVRREVDVPATVELRWAGGTARARVDAR